MLLKLNLLQIYVAKVKLCKLKLYTDQDSEFTESESLFDYGKSKSTASSTLNYFSWVIVVVTCLGDAPNSDWTFNVVKPHNIAGKPKPPSKDYLLEKTFQDLNIVLDL